MFLKSDPYRVWCSIFYSKLINCIILRSLCSTFVLWKVGEHAVAIYSGERNVKILIDFRKSPRFSLTSPLSQLREKSSRPVFTMCGESCYYYFGHETQNEHYYVFAFRLCYFTNDMSFCHYAVHPPTCRKHFNLFYFSSQTTSLSISKTTPLVNRFNSSLTLY